MIFCHLLIFLEIFFFRKFYQEYHLSVKQFGSNALSSLIWVQIVCISYQQTTLVGKELKVKKSIPKFDEEGKQHISLHAG